MITANGLTRLDETIPGHLELVQQWFIGQLPPEKLAELLR